MPTSSSSSAAFCSAAQLLELHRWETIADWLTPAGDARVSQGSLSSNGVVLRALKRGAGEIEAAAQVGKKYTAADLAALTGVGLEYLIGLNGDLAYWHIAKFFNYSYRPDQIAGAEQAIATLNSLRLGEMVFGIVEVQEASIIEVVEPPKGSQDDLRRLSRQASRLFGQRAE